MKSPVALTAGQFLYWYDINTGGLGAQPFMFTASAGSVVFECGTYKTEGLSITAENTNTRLMITIPAGVTCLAEELISVTIREWSNTATAASTVL
jgi:hypothetical protein